MNRIIVLVLSLLLAGCPSITSVDSWAKPWVGESIERIEAMHQRDKESWYSVKHISSNRSVYTELERDFSHGRCYVDFVVDQNTGKIIDYRVYGDKKACR